MNDRPMPETPLRLYHHPLSGHAHRAELMLSLLGLPYERIAVDLLRGEQKSPAFLAKNPFGQVPVLEDGGHVLADSLAIVAYLTTRYDPEHRFWPREPVGAAEVQRWLSVAAGPLVAGPATARIEVLFGRPRDPRAHAVADKLFSVLEPWLATRRFLAAETATVADVAMYTYTAHAPEGGVSLDPFPAIRAWLARVEGLPGFVGMVRSPVADPVPA